MELYLIRHTSPEVEKGICYGQTDLALAQSFPEEAAKLKLLLPSSFTKIYSSPLLRCRQFASHLDSSGTVVTDPRLMELNFGAWEGKKWDDIPAKELDPWMKDFVHVAAPEGENFEMLYNRTEQFYKDLLKREAKRVAVVCHAGVIRAFLTIILEMPLRNAFKIPVSYGSVTKLHLNTESCYCSLEYLNRV
jgi:alpha-ribazole phosphatase